MLFFNNIKHFSNNTVKIVTYALACATVCIGLNANIAPAGSTNKYSTRDEKIKLVEHAVEQYQTENRTSAKEHFEKAESVFPENYIVPYYLGLIHLEEGNRAAAISKWQRYVSMDSQSKNSMKIRKYLTLLNRKQAAENAKKVVAQKSIVIKKPMDEISIAVTAFDNVDYMILGPLGKGIAAMLISDLSRIQDLTVVDRIQLHALLREMAMGSSGLVDAKAVPSVAKRLQVDQVITGNLKDLEGENLEISASVFDTNQNKIIGNQQEKGALTQFYVLEKKIACMIVAALGKNCDSMPRAFQKVHTNSMSALVAFSWGLDHFDQERYDKAREMFQKALEDDPQFELAEKALLTTPTNAMAAMPVSEMISDISSTAKSIEAASGISTETEKGGISKAVLIGGGIAILGGGVALVGGSQESSPSQPVPPNPGGGSSLTGLWSGSVWGSNGEEYGFNMSLVHTGTTVNGNINFNQWECIQSGTISGTVTLIDSDQILNLSIQSQTSPMSLVAEGVCSATQIDADAELQGSAADTCAFEASALTAGRGLSIKEK